MTRAGFCNVCGDNVWLNADGSCVNGHPASCVRDGYEVVPPTPIQSVPQKKSHTGLIVGIVVGLLGVLFVCGILAAIAVPVFFNSSSNAAEQSCWANERYVESVVQLYVIENEGAKLPSDWDGLMSVLVAEPDLSFEKAPVCPSGGTYSVTGSGEDLRVTCSIHGQAPESSTP